MITSNNSDNFHGSGENPSWSEKAGFKAKTLNQSELEAFRKPFDLGWKREIVLEFPYTSSNKKIVDIFYYSPDKNVKLRSYVEIGLYLDRHPETDLVLDNFTFARQSIWHTPYEFIKNPIARTMPTFKASALLSNHNSSFYENDRTRKKFIAETIIKIELCSILGQKLLVRLPNSKYNFSMNDLYVGHEKFCSTDDRDIIRSVLSQVNRPRPASKGRITRSNNIINGVEVPSWGPRHFFHTYTFGKTQRLEKWLTLESGLNWKGRLNELYCKKFKIVAPKLLSCPLCKTHIGRVKVHCCSDSIDR